MWKATAILSLLLEAMAPSVGPTATTSGSSGSASTEPGTPAETPAGTLDLRDFGCRGDGIRDDGACLQAALDAAATEGRGLFLPKPPVAYRSARSLWLRHAYGIRITGDNSWATVIRFDLPAGSTGLWLYNCYGVTLAHLQLRGSDVAPLNAVINIQGDSADPAYSVRPPGSLRFTSIRVVGGDAYAEYGVRFTIAPGSKDWNNDLSIWSGVDVAKVRRAAVAIEHGNSKQHVFRDCKLTYLGRGSPRAPRGQGSWSDFPDDEGHGIWARRGSFRWYDGYVGVFKGAAFRIDEPNVDGLVVLGGNFESGARILDVTSLSSQPFQILLAGNRYSAAFVEAPGAATERDGQIVRVGCAVVATIESNRFGSAGQTSATRLAFTTDAPSAVTVAGNAFESGGSALTEALITAGPAVELDLHGNTYRGHGGVRLLKGERRLDGVLSIGWENRRPGSRGRNLRGTVTIRGTNPVGEARFAELGGDEPDDHYFVTVGPAYAILGTPVPGATRLRRIVKGTRGITFELEAPPGPGAEVSFDWIIVR